ncbi:MAG: hypothetical protein ACOH1I_02095 [Gallionellaceae bacterium]
MQMNQDDTPPPITERGVYLALMYALIAERLSVYYEHEHWMTQAQGAALAANWLSRSKRNMPVAMRKHLSELSDKLARQIADTTSREAGLFISHEMQESLDPRYHSEIGESIMMECERVFDQELPE